MMVLRQLLVLLLTACFFSAALARCSPAEQECGELCCCVTCKCLEGPDRCEDMWGKPTDPVGRVDDERFESREWTENLMREHQERHRRWLEEHEERRRQRREARRARGEPEEEELSKEGRFGDQLRHLPEEALERMRRWEDEPDVGTDERRRRVKEALADMDRRRTDRRRERRRERGFPEDDEMDEDLAKKADEL